MQNFCGAQIVEYRLLPKFRGHVPEEQVQQVRLRVFQQPRIILKLGVYSLLGTPQRRIDQERIDVRIPIIDQFQDLRECRDPEHPIKRLRAHTRQSLMDAQGLDFVQIEVVREVSGAIQVRGILQPIREFGRHVGGVIQVHAVDGDQVSVLGCHQVGFDVIGAQFHCESVGWDRVFWQMRRGAAVCDDDLVGTIHEIVWQLHRWWNAGQFVVDVVAVACRRGCCGRGHHQGGDEKEPHRQMPRSGPHVRR
mmetsp:Transcript_9841/g.27839  ORF Transcript_9841/g.27839 Transcript_9841/m.27839 type:complete len:250 (-) Transcript_9841:150-899(-)